MTKQLVALIATTGKTPDQVTAELIKAVEAFRVAQALRPPWAATRDPGHDLPQPAPHRAV